MQSTRIAVLLAALLAVARPACVHAQSATPPASTPPGDAARSQLMDIYQEYCLDRFPNRARLLATITDRKFPLASKADADRALKNRTGQAWVVAKPAGNFLLALWDTPQRGCAITGTAPDDASTRATFDLVVTMYAGQRELGALTRPPIRTGQVNGKPATLQLIGVQPDNQPSEAFVNVAVTRPDGTEARLAREWGPPAPPTPDQSKP